MFLAKSSYEIWNIRLFLKASGKRVLWQLLQLEQLILDLLTSVVYFISSFYATILFLTICVLSLFFVIFKTSCINSVTQYCLLMLLFSSPISLLMTWFQLQLFMEPDLKTNNPKWLLHSEPPDEHVYESNGVGIMQKKGDEVVI